MQLTVCNSFGAVLLLPWWHDEQTECNHSSEAVHEQSREDWEPGAPGDEPGRGRKRLWAATRKVAMALLGGQFLQEPNFSEDDTASHWRELAVNTGGKCISLDIVMSSHRILQGDISVLNFLLRKYFKRHNNAFYPVTESCLTILPIPANTWLFWS